VGKFLACLITALFLFSTSAGAEDVSIEIIKSTSRWGTSLPSVSDDVNVITEPEIIKLPARDVGETLEYTPGVIVDRAGGPGSFVFPSIQGSEFFETLVMINGIPLNDLTNGIGNIGQIPAEQISRIEVIHGAGGVQWGSALGGVINVITHKAEPGAPDKVLVGGGDYAARFGAVTLQQSAGPLSTAIGGGFRRAEGPEGERRQMGMTNVLGSASYQLDNDNSLFFQGYNFKGNIAGGEYHVTSPASSWAQGYWSKYTFDTAGVGSTFEGNLGRIKIQATGYYQNQLQSTFDNYPDPAQNAQSYYSDSILGGSLILHATLDATDVTAGFENKGGKLVTTALAQPSYLTATSGLFVNFQHNLAPFVLNVGARHSEETLYGGFDGWNFGATYLGSAVNVRASVAHGYNAPPLSFRFLEITNLYKPNPNLVPEKTTSYNLGFTTNPAMPLSLNYNMFYAQISDAMDVVTDSNNISMYQNFKKFTRQGIEAEVRAKLTDGVTAFANTFQLDVKDEAGNLVSGKLKSTYAVGTEYRTSSWTAVLNGIYKIYNLDLVAGYPEKDFQWVWNAKGSYLFYAMDRPFNLTASVYNITDRQIGYNALAPWSPPRQAELSVGTGF